MRLGTDARNDACAAIVGRTDLGSTNPTGRLLFYQGTLPANPQAAPASLLLVSLDLANPGFVKDTGVQGRYETPGPVSATAIAAGQINWCRLIDRTGTVTPGILDMTCAKSAADIIFDSNDVVVGSLVTLGALAISVPQGP